MSFKGQFNWIQSMRQGGRKAISVTLTCTNLFKSETFDAAIIDCTGQQQPMLFSQLSLGAKKSFRFDMDTVGWDWCQGDTFAVLDKNGQMGKDNKWTLNIHVPAPGECRDCHGTGMCQTCYVPIRNVVNPIATFQPNSNIEYRYNSTSADSSNQEAAKQRKIAALRQRI